MAIGKDIASILTLFPKTFVKVRFDDSDGEFEIHFDSKEHPDQIVVKETSGLPGSILGEANEVLYVEDFAKIEAAEKESDEMLGGPEYMLKTYRNKVKQAEEKLNSLREKVKVLEAGGVID